MKREPLCDQVVKEIIAGIAQGLYPVGNKLPSERQMSESFSVSRITLRQALAKLHMLKVVTVRHGSGHYVNDFKKVILQKEFESEIIGFDRDTLREIIVARRAIEGMTAGLAAKNRSSEDIKQLQECADNMESNMDNLQKFIRADVRFHQHIAEASGNRVLAKVLASVADQQRFSMLFTSYKVDDQKRTIKYHDRILHAIELKNEIAARRAIASHFTDMEKYLG